MGWETRGGKARYFYRSQKLADDWVRKRYFGKGLRAEIESLWMERKAEARRQVSRERQLIGPAETLLRQHIRSTSDVVHGLMLTVGYTNERSRGWRPLRMIAPNDQPNDDGDADVATLTVDQFPDLVQKARQGDRKVIPALRRMMRANPELAKNSGDLASQTQIHWVDLIAGRDLYYRECLLMKIAEFKQELLADTHRTVVERMMVDLVISSWLQVHYHEDREATRPAENIQLGEYRLKKIESAFNRHLKSLGALSALKAVKFTSEMAKMLENRTDFDQVDRVRRPSSLPKVPNNRLQGLLGGIPIEKHHQNATLP